MFFMATYTKQDYWNWLSNGQGSDFRYRGMTYDDFVARNGGTDDLFAHTYFDDDYLKEIEQYKGKFFYENLLNNPWLAGNQSQFSPSTWQSISESVNDFSARDAYNASLRSQRSQWLTDKLAQYEQQDWNSPLAQVQREQVAGINPDLAGNITPGSASENDQPSGEVPMQLPGQSDFTSIGNFAMSLLSNIMGMAKSIQSLKANSIVMDGQELSNIGQEISNNKDAVGYVVEQIAGQSHFKTVDDIDNLTADELGELVLDASQKIDYRRYSPKTRKLLKSYFGIYAKDKHSGKYPLAVETLRAQLRERYANAHFGAIKSSSNPYFSEDFDTFLSKYASIIGKAEYNAYMAQIGAQSSKGNYDSRYFHFLDPEKQAIAQNNEADYSASINKQHEAEESVYTELYKFFMEDKSWYSKVGLIVLPLVRNLLKSASESSFSFGKKAISGGTTDRRDVYLH